MKTIILAGGKSSRMGQNKAVMKVGGVRVIDRLLTELGRVSDEVILIANDQIPYKDLNVTLLQDAAPFQGQGPLAGIYTGLSAAGQDVCLVVACDMPFASAHFGTFLAEKLQETGCDAVVPIYDGQMHPLFAAYDGRIVDKVKEALQSGKRSMRALLDQLHVQYVQMENNPQVVWNMNTMDDYIEAVKLAEGREQHEL